MIAETEEREREGKRGDRQRICAVRTIVARSFVEVIAEMDLLGEEEDRKF